jgi:hypothetical protein
VKSRVQIATEAPPVITELPPIEKRCLLLPLGFVLSLLIRRALARGDIVEGASFGFHPHVGVARKHGAAECPAMLMITSSPAPDSESSVTSVCLLSCHRPTTLALSRTFVHAVRNVVTGWVGSFDCP